MYSYVTPNPEDSGRSSGAEASRLADRALARLDGELEKLYAATGRPSIAPERLLRAMLLMVLYSIRSERQLMEQMNYNLLFRWFVGLEMDDPIWDVTVFTKNRERLIEGAVSQMLLESVLFEAREHDLLSEEHFTVDGTLIQAWASARSFQPKADPRRAISQKKRKLVEKVFGWAKLDSVLRQVKVRGLKRVDWFYRLTMAAYNLLRIRRLIPIEAAAS